MPVRSFDPGTPPGERGNLTVAPKVVERIARAACLEVDGSARSGSSFSDVRHRSLPRAEATLAGGHASLDIHIAARWPVQLTHETNNVKDRVSERLATLAGINVDRAVVTVTSIVTDRDARPQRRVQ